LNCPLHYSVPESNEKIQKDKKEKKIRKILDEKYEIIKTIGEGRFAKVKLAVDIKTKKQVAVKIMRVKNMVNKKECLDCFFTEINILTECRHPNIVKILDASFDGLIVKEQLIENDDDYQFQNC
jgi:serine/threonine protein kinase